MINLDFSSTLSQLLQSKEIGRFGKSELKNKQTPLFPSYTHAQNTQTHMCVHALCMC